MFWVSSSDNSEKGLNTSYPVYNGKVFSLVYKKMPHSELWKSKGVVFNGVRLELLKPYTLSGWVPGSGVARNVRSAAKESRKF